MEKSPFLLKDKSSLYHKKHFQISADIGAFFEKMLNLVF